MLAARARLVPGLSLKRSAFSSGRPRAEGESDRYPLSPRIQTFLIPCSSTIISLFFEPIGFPELKGAGDRPHYPALHKRPTIRLTAPAYWKFESSPLQRRVRCEPVSRENSPSYVE
jgi:hypothetical protein